MKSIVTALAALSLAVVAVPTALAGGNPPGPSSPGCDLDGRRLREDPVPLLPDGFELDNDNEWTVVGPR